MTPRPAMRGAVDDDFRQKRVAVYLFASLAGLLPLGFMTVNYIQAHQNHAGSGFGDTAIIEDDPGAFFERGGATTNLR